MSTETAKVQDTSAANTTVKIKKTVITYLLVDETDNSTSVHKLDMLGKVSIPTCKKMVKELEGETMFFKRELTEEKFQVNTVELYSLKLNDVEPETETETETETESK